MWVYGHASPRPAQGRFWLALEVAQRARVDKVSMGAGFCLCVARLASCCSFRRVDLPLRRASARQIVVTKGPTALPLRSKRPSVVF